MSEFYIKSICQMKNLGTVWELLTKWPQKISNGNLSRKKDAHWRHFMAHIIRFKFKAVAERRQ